ncbi:hypothetical protein [Acinetobacter populi]|uniref:SCP2 domain-containing protein n=1 Tax=Acinetobacter populi TaxID=1582270 RepID=A0A1Z9YYT2_9GAMM|nr:hypothetical protein [Acinetobacter populi]OUY07380.1 hypothetical protein CAP51_06335 [Acinetobacter populi]
MNDSQQNKNNPHLLQSLVLIFLETVLTFVLKHDRIAREHAKPFIKSKICIQFNTFLPSEVFYVTFDQKGLLFDFHQPQHVEAPQFVISASGLDLFRILLTGSESSIRKIRMTGEEHLHDEFRILLSSLSLPAVTRDWKNWLAADDVSTKIPKQSIESLFKRIEQQRSQINQLTIENKSYQFDLKTLQHKYKLMCTIFGLIIFILLVSIVTLLWYNFA